MKFCDCMRSFPQNLEAIVQKSANCLLHKIHKHYFLSLLKFPVVPIMYEFSVLINKEKKNSAVLFKYLKKKLLSVFRTLKSENILFTKTWFYFFCRNLSGNVYFKLINLDRKLKHTILVYNMSNFIK